MSPAGIEGARDSIGRAVDIARTLPTNVSEPLIEAARIAFMSGFHTTILVSVALLGLGTLISAVALRPRERSVGLTRPDR